ncbi:MAG: leucine-rich repeat domain-containing protein [Lishizhenia sp.]
MNKQFVIVFLLLIFNRFCFSQVETNAYTFITWEIAQTANPDAVFAITFEKNKVSKLPEKLARYTNLLALELGKNKLDTLPLFISEFTQLQYIGFSKNQMDHFPVFLCKLPLLKSIDASRNNIEKLPNCLSYLQNLEALDLWDTGLRELPHDFELLAPKLTYLDLRGMTYSPEYIEKWKALLPNTTFEHEIPCNCVK